MPSSPSRLALSFLAASAGLWLLARLDAAAPKLAARPQMVVPVPTHELGDRR